MPHAHKPFFICQENARVLFSAFEEEIDNYNENEMSALSGSQEREISWGEKIGSKLILNEKKTKVRRILIKTVSE